MAAIAGSQGNRVVMPGNMVGDPDNDLKTI